MSSVGGRIVVVVLAGVAVAGCSHQEFSRPVLRRPDAAISDLLDSGAPYVEPGQSLAQQRVERLAQVLAAWESRPHEGPPDYVIGPGDELDVAIFALEVPDSTTTLARTVSQDGHITVPWVGRLQASGLTVRELEEAAKAAYGGRYLKNPQITVTVTEYHSAAVVVTGAVREPGVYYLRGVRSTVLSLLAEAGGLAEEAGDRVRVARPERPSPVPPPTDGVVELTLEGNAPGPSGPEAGPELGEERAVTIDLKELIDEGNLLLNLEVTAGDIITVPPRTEQYVYVLGYVQRPGAYELKDGVQVDALRAVAMAQGLSTAARAENSLLIRETAEGQMVVPVDLTKIARDVRPPIYMEPGDTLVVGSSMVARLSEFVRPSAGVHYYPGQ